MSAKQHSTLLGKVLVALKYISLIVITLVCLAPIILAAVTSLKSKTEVYDLGVLQLPETLHFENYITAFVDGNMLNGFKNTAIMVGVSLIFVILNGTMVAGAWRMWRAVTVSRWCCATPMRMRQWKKHT